MPRQGSSKASKDSPETATRMARTSERSVIHRRGKGTGAFDELIFLDELEDRLDAEEASALLADASAKRQEPIPWGTAKKKLGL